MHRLKKYMARMEPRDWFSIKAAAKGSDTTDVLIYDVISSRGYGIGAAEFNKALMSIDTPKINLFINSIGGEVFEGFSIYTALVRHPAKIHSQIDGLAASIMSIVALAGDTVSISNVGFTMIHSPWGGLVGNAKDMRQEADTLDKLENKLVEIYVAKTGLPEADIRAMMDAETLMDAETSVKHGFADSIFGDKKEPEKDVIENLKIYGKSPAGFTLAETPPAEETKAELEPKKQIKTGITPQRREGYYRARGYIK